MKLFTCSLLVVLLPGFMLGDTDVCPDRPVMEIVDCGLYKGRWYAIMRTGAPDGTKCQQQVIRGEESEPTASISFKFSFLNDTEMSLDGTIRKTDTPGRLRFALPHILQEDESTYSILETDYLSYAVIDMCWKFNENHQNNYVTVLSRTTSLLPESRIAVDAVLDRNHIVTAQMLHISHEACTNE